MTLQEIKNKAILEQTLNIDIEIDLIKNTIKQNPSGQDLRIPNEKMLTIIQYCDEHLIPVYQVTNNCLSVASTYSNLVLHESIR